MPFYSDDEEELKRIRRTSTCAICGRQLYIYLDMKTKKQYVACPTPGHEGLSREYKPQRVDYQSNIRREMELENKYGQEKTKALAKLPMSGALTQSEAMQILKLVYPGVPEDEIVRCALLCRDFGLHPLMKEVYIIPFGTKGGGKNWVTVLGIGATRKMMSQRGSYSYLDNTPRVMTDKEQKDIFGEVDNEKIIAITKLKTEKGMEAQGYGRIGKSETIYGVDKGNTRANMAFIRSERNAFGRLFTDALPQGIEVIDEAYVEVPGIGMVEKETGEIQEGEFEEVAETKEKSPPAPPSPEATELEAHDEQQQPQPAGATLEELKEAMTLCLWTETDLGHFISQEKKWKFSMYKDLTPEQIKEVIDEINANPK